MSDPLVEPASRPAPPAPPAPPAGPAASVLGARSTERPADAGVTLVGGIGADRPARVDGGGLVSPSGADWRLDWWVGADDRWHLPAREPAVRQRRIGPGPVIETSLRVPSGDVVATAYPVVAAGHPATVVEIRNDSPVPVALALAMRPRPVDGSTGTGGPDSQPGAHRLELAADRRSITVDGRTAMVLPRQPNEAGADASDDLLAAVLAGERLSWSGPVEGVAANAVCLYPLPHSTSLRVTLPGPGPDPDPGSATDPGSAPNSAPGPDPAPDRLPLDEAAMERLRPEVLPDAAAVARGWTSVVDQGGSFRFPDSGLTDLAGAARARLILSAADLPGRVEALRSGAGLVLEALAVGGHGAECRPALERLAAGFPARLTDGAPAAADLVFGVAVAAELVGDPDLTDRLLAPATQLTQLVDRSRDADAATLARLGLARLADLAGQHQAAARLRAEAGSPSIPGREPSLDPVVTLAERAAPAGRWNADADAGPGLVDDDRTAARFLLAARRLLLQEPAAGGDGPSACMVELLPIFPTAWLGGEVEVHRAPVAGVRVSFAIRWHGYRPALLWEIEGSTSSDPTAIGPGGGPLVLTCPGLDPAWSSDQATGETLLAGSAVELPDAPGPGDSFN